MRSAYRSGGHRVVLVLISTLLGVAACGQPAATHDLVSPRIDAQVTVDGRLDEAVWAHAARIGELVTLGAMLAPAHEPTHASVMHDGEMLYIGVHCTGGVRGPISALPRDDRRIYEHQRIELLFNPAPESEGGYVIVVDRAGNTRTAMTVPGQAERDPAWGEDIQSAVAEIEGGWSVEVAVPFAALDLSVPDAGGLWRLKVCRDGGPDRSLSWPPNPTSSFHTREADGALYFERMNLLSNGDFQQGDVGEHLPPGWSASMTSPEVDNTIQGTVETVEGAGVDGGRAVRLTKLISALYWPQIWSRSYELAVDGAYEFSIMVRGDLPNVNLRVNMFDADGRRVARPSETFDTPGDWTRLHTYFRPAEGIATTSVGLSAPHMIQGQVFFDQAVLRRVLTGAGDVAATAAATYERDQDQFQGLEALMERSGVKPYDLFWDGEALKTLRVIFRDRQFGTEVWMLDNSPTVDHCITASVWPAWNANASHIRVSGNRPVDEGTPGGFIFNEDFSRMSRHISGTWSRTDPDLRFIHRPGALQIGDSRTGEIRDVATWEPFPRERVYGLTRDGRYAFLDTPNGGIWLTYEPGDVPIPRLGLYDGRPEAPGKVVLSQSHSAGPNVLHGGGSCTADTAEWGPLFRVRVGILIDIATGEMEHVIAPLCGHAEYLRTYISGRVNFPTGDQYEPFNGPGWEHFRIMTSDDPEELFRMYRYLPATTHGHESSSPCGEYIAKDGGTTRIIRKRDGHVWNVNLSPNGGNYHLHWIKHPRFFVGWVRGWSFGSFLRPANANVEFQVFSDRTFQPIVDTKHLFNGYYGGGDFSMLSPDATKIHYGSSMTGRFKNYIAVMARPRPPVNPSWVADADAVVLNWEPSAYSRETRGYLVYRSDLSGDGYELLTPTPVEATTWRDESVERGRAYHYVLTSIENWGLESGYSSEIARAGVNLPPELDSPLIVYAEPEASIKDLATEAEPGLAMGVDRREASDWYYLYRHPGAQQGRASMPVSIPAAGEYHLWARVRSARVARTVWTIDAGGAGARDVATGESEWAWVRAEGPLRLTGGALELSFITGDRDAELDLVCLATSSEFTPAGPRPEKASPPLAITGLTAENVRERVNRLTWERPDDPHISHYQVYASHEPISGVSQELLIGSPTTEELIDWGLRAGTEYYYAVTTVDRRGNESEIVTARAATPAGPPEVHVALAFAEAELQGPFEQSEADATHGAFYVVPQDPEENSATWEVDLARDGDYAFWLRYLHRGDGGRGGEVTQNVEVLLDGERVTTLGGGLTDLHAPDTFLTRDHPLAPQLWTWAWPGNSNLTQVRIPAGRHTLRLQKLVPGIRYDALVITNEPSWVPEDGRLRQR